jgi:hypothetical protein
MGAESVTAGGAVLDAAARRLAIAASLPLLATYFASAETWDLAVQPAVSDLEGQLDVKLASAVRLRVMLALAQELLPILQTIMARPTFRYSQRAAESVGLLAGRLDVPRYVQRRSGRTAPKVYPVRVVERDRATPENVLAVSALQAISRALRAVPTHMLPSRSSPESRQLAVVRSDLRRYERMPLAIGIGAQATAAARWRTLPQQRHDVMRRIERGDVRHAAPYRRLTDWVGAFLTGAGVKPESRPWAFYDERFDSRLLEIWTLGALTACLTQRYGDPDGGSIAPLWTRHQGPVAAWSTPYGRVEMFFQRETGGIGLPGRWTIPSRNHRLRAIPDITLHVTLPDNEGSWLLLDCKLRRHQPLPGPNAQPGGPNDDPGQGQGERGLDLPIEEIYKLFGYFEHLLSETQPVGALVYYTPGGNGTLNFEAEGPRPRTGEAALIGVDPAHPADAMLAICAVGDQVGSLLGEPGPLASDRRPRVGSPEDLGAEHPDDVHEDEVEHH